VGPLLYGVLPALSPKIIPRMSPTLLPVLSILSQKKPELPSLETKVFPNTLSICTIEVADMMPNVSITIAINVNDDFNLIFII
jgi:hypothetical protein